MVIRKLKERKNLGLKPEVIAAVAQFSFILFVILARLNIPEMSFVEGVLLGISITGNLAWLIIIRREEGK